MKEINITLKDGSCRAYPRGTTALEVARSISQGLARNAMAVKINGRLADLSTPLGEDAEMEILGFDTPGGKHAFWHTGSHVLAQAVKRLYPEALLTIGPAIENGFYYDFDVPAPFTQEDLEAIQAEMKKIVKEALPVERFALPRDEAIQFMKERGEPYKVELIEALPQGEEISFYKQGEFVDLCAGPHVPNTSVLKAVHLIQVTGAYWHADANNKMLQRVYGIAFPKTSELEAYLHMLEEAKRRDHRKLGRELELFDIFDEGRGFPFFFPKGMVLRNELESFWRRIHTANGYQEIKTPIMLSQELWIRSGHWEHYQQNMYTTLIDETPYAVKPMNCPGAILVYSNGLHSYRNLPMRLGDLGVVHRHELSGVLHGLMRVRSFTQDDAHIFMTTEQVSEEIRRVIDLVDHIYQVFGFEYHVELSTRPEDSMGTDEQWEHATSALRSALEARGTTFVINEGDGAFYGPKIDFHLRDSLGRTWQCGTIQLDFQLPERFELEYVDAGGEKQRPVMIHRVAFGSVERFIAILTEHFAGAFPLWLSPVQAKVLPITERQHKLAAEIGGKLTGAGLRVEVDDRSEKIGLKIREAQLQKINYMLVLGDKEQESGLLSVRHRAEGDLGTVSLDDFIQRCRLEIEGKEIR